MFCPVCGTQLSDDAKFCGVCGTPVANDSTSTQASIATTMRGQLESVSMSGDYMANVISEGMARQARYQEARRTLGALHTGLEDLRRRIKACETLGNILAAGWVLQVVGFLALFNKTYDPTLTPDGNPLLITVLVLAFLLPFTPAVRRMPFGFSLGRQKIRAFMANWGLIFIFTIPFLIGVYSVFFFGVCPITGIPSYRSMKKQEKELAAAVENQRSIVASLDTSM